MKKLTLSLLLICNLCLFGCSTDSETLKERDDAKLNKMHQDLIDLSESQTRPCTNPDEWAYIKIANICGSYEYMIYSKKINTAEFLKKTEEYNKAREIFYGKWPANCAVISIWNPGIPKGLDCYDGKPIILYNTALK